MTPDEIKSQRFGLRLLRGLKPEEVTAFLEEVAEEFEAVQQMNSALERHMAALQERLLGLTTKQASVAPPDAFIKTELQASSIIQEAEQKENAAASRIEVLRTAALQEVEALLHDAQTRTQAMTDAAQERAAVIIREAEALKSQRQLEAEELVIKATATADRILMAARDQEAAVRREIDCLTETRLRLFDDVRASLDVCHEWLATVDPRMRAMGVGGRQHVLSESVTNGGLNAD
jgi:DivIVA domain-containing protein